MVVRWTGQLPIGLPYVPKKPSHNHCLFSLSATVVTSHARYIWAWSIDVRMDVQSKRRSQWRACKVYLAKRDALTRQAWIWIPTFRFLISCSMRSKLDCAKVWERGQLVFYVPTIDNDRHDWTLRDFKVSFATNQGYTYTHKYFKPFQIEIVLQGTDCQANICLWLKMKTRHLPPD